MTFRLKQLMFIRSPALGWCPAWLLRSEEAYPPGLPHTYWVATVQHKAAPVTRGLPLALSPPSYPGAPRHQRLWSHCKSDAVPEDTKAPLFCGNDHQPTTCTGNSAATLGPTSYVRLPWKNRQCPEGRKIWGHSPCIPDLLLCSNPTGLAVEHEARK